MAVKFSQFSNISPTAGTYLVGYDGANNIKIQYSSLLSGTSNYLTKWGTPSGLVNSLVFDNGTSVGIGTATPDTTSVLTIQRGSKTENLWLTSSDGANSIEFSNNTGTIRTGIQADSTGLGFGGGASFRNALFILRTTNNVAVNTTTDTGYKFKVAGSISCGSGGVIAGWDLHVAGTQRTDGNLLAAGGIQTNGITNAGSSITISCNSIVDRLLIFSDGAASVGNKNVFQFNTNIVSGITAGNSANIIKTTFSVSSIPTTGILNINNLTPTINQTTGTGTIYGFRFDPVNTAVLSKVYAFHSSSGNVNFSGLPTSSAGLASGDLWNDGGTLKIV